MPSMICVESERQNNMNNDQAETQKRNLGIDLLRILSMYMIVTVHFLGAGGVRNNTTGVNYAVAWFFEAICYCAVDCYALISGYVNCTKKINRINRMMKLWLQVIYYTIGFFLIFLLTKAIRFNVKDAIHAVLPITTSHYWYVTAYMGLLVLMPYLNTLIEGLNRNQAATLIVVLALTFSCYATFALRLGDPMGLNGGYSMLWLIILYLIGASTRRFAFFEHVSPRVFIIVMLLCVCLTWLWKMTVPARLSPSWFFSYTSPTVLISAVCLIGIFMKINVSGKCAIGVIRASASATLGIYLIHENELISSLLTGRFSCVGSITFWVFPLCVILFPAFLFLVCLIIEKARQGLFKMFGADRLIDRLSAGIDARFNRILRKTDY